MSIWNGPKVEQDLSRLAGLGLKAAAMHLTRRVKEVLSSPAPRRRVKSPSGIYYRATAPAQPGAPPRKLSGRLRASIAYEMSPDGNTARVGTNVIYARRLEKGYPLGHKPHPFLYFSLVKYRSELATIIGATYQSK